jgi:hypothetical protein
MWSHTHTTSLVLLCALFWNAASTSPSTCRNIPGSSGYPSPVQWNTFNLTISGRLVPVVPSAKYCESLPRGACTDEEWSSALFRGTIPGAMDQVRVHFHLFSHCQFVSLFIMSCLGELGTSASALAGPVFSGELITDRAMISNIPLCVYEMELLRAGKETSRSTQSKQGRLKISRSVIPSLSESLPHISGNPFIQFSPR